MILHKNDEAVSTVIAAIMVLAILVTFLSAINAFYIPSLAADNEVSHIRDVRNSFVEIASKAASGSSNEKIQLPLGSGGLPLSFTPSSSGSLTVNPDSGWINISMKDAAIPKREFDGVNKLRNLTDVCTLYLISNGTISIYTVTLDDDNQITVARESQSMVVDSECNGHSSQKRVATPDTDNKYFIFDLLNPVFGFSDALKNSSTPFSLMLEGSFFVEYDKLPPYADNEKVDAGDKQTNITTGNIKYTSSNNFWIDQEFVFENGAVILKQSTSNESLIRSQPFITLDKNDKQLNIEVFRIVDAADSVSGNGVSTINLHVEKENEEIYPSVAKTTIQISSDYPDAWQKYLSQLDSSSEIRDGVVVASFSDKSVKISVTDVSIMLP